jgi:hypothetical protein
MMEITGFLLQDLRALMSLRVTGRVGLASKRAVGAKLKDAQSSHSNVCFFIHLFPTSRLLTSVSSSGDAAKDPVPPEFGKATIHSRNARQLERANSLVARETVSPVRRESTNAVPLGMRASTSDAQYAGTTSKSL